MEEQLALRCQLLIFDIIQMSQHLLKHYRNPYFLLNKNHKHNCVTTVKSHALYSKRIDEKIFPTTNSFRSFNRLLSQID